MSIEEFKVFNKSISLEEKSDLNSIYKIKSFEQKLKQIEAQKIPQKPIKDVLNHLIVKNNLLSKKTKESFKKVKYSKSERLVILFTNSGNEVIWNREKLIKEYGWYFYTIEDKGDKKGIKARPKQDQPKEENTIGTEPYLYEGFEISIKQKTNMRALYNTKEYKQHLNIIRSKKVVQMPIKDVINDLFLKNELIPLKEKKAIRKIIYYQSEKVIVIKSLIGDHMYENLQNLVTKYGWFFYITGVPVGDSEISNVVDKIEKRFTADYFKDISLKESDKPNEKISVALYPIVIKPNHNCIILRIGKFNLMLDCGILEHHFDHIKRYLENYDLILEEKEKQRQNENKQNETTTVEIKRPEERLKELKELVDFEGGEKDSENESEDIDKGEAPLKSFESVILETKNVTSESPPLTNSNITPKYKIDAIFISHSHFDHVTGLMELIKRYPDIPILTSRLTMDLFLLRDSNFLKQEKHDSLEQDEYLKVVKNVIFVENGSKIEFKDKDCFLSFFHAGHMPGALMILAKANDFRFLFTGDYTYWDVTPFAGTRRFLDQVSRPIDFLLIDGTSAYEDFGDPQQQIDNLILFMEQKADYGDNSLIGADPSSLAITFMLTLWRFFRKLQLREDFKKRPNIYVDMMVRKNIQVINHRYEYIYGPISKLIRDKANPFNSIKFRWFDHGDLEFLRSKNNIIISHPPDLSYGIIRPIINVIGRNKHNLVFLSGAINEQPGLDLISGAQEIEFSETWKFPFRALLLNTFMPQLKIKLHGDKSQLLEMIKSLQPKEVCFYHQSPRKLVDVANEVKLLGVKKVSIPRKRMLVFLN